MYEMIERCTHVKERHTIFRSRTYKVDVKREKDFIGINKWQHPWSWSSCLDRQPTSMFYIFVVYIIFWRNLEYTYPVFRFISITIIETICLHCRCFKCKKINKATVVMIFWNRISLMPKKHHLNKKYKVDEITSRHLRLWVVMFSFFVQRQGNPFTTKSF